MIDRDRAWTAKRAALALVFAAGLEPGRAIAFRAFCRREGDALDAFAVWSALSEVHGRDWHTWPVPLRHPGSRGRCRVRRRALRARRVPLVAAVAPRRAVGAGAGFGAPRRDAAGHRARPRCRREPDRGGLVGLAGRLARGITVGAPPDPYAQTGQDWSQPPWRPDRLADLAYAPFRDLIRQRAAARRRACGSITSSGLFRLWWIPAGSRPDRGHVRQLRPRCADRILALRRSAPTRS